MSRPGRLGVIAEPLLRSAHGPRSRFWAGRRVAARAWSSLPVGPDGARGVIVAAADEFRRPGPS